MIKLIQLSDTHIMDNPDDLLFGVINPDTTLQKLIPLINVKQPDYVLITGDLTQNGSILAYKRLQAILSKLDCKHIYVLPGNHDNLTNMTNTLLNENISILDQLNLGKWQIYGLNSQKVGFESGLISQQDLQDLDRRLNQQSNMKKSIIALHHHFLKLDSAIDSCMLENAQALIDIIIKHKHKIAFCVNGHVHNPITTYCTEIPVYNCMSSCVQFAIAPTFKMDTTTTAGFRIFKLE